MSLTIDLTGKTALITGAAKGIGAECARTLARAGARIAINYRKSEEQAFALVDELNTGGFDAMCIRFDVSDRAAAREGVGRIESDFGVIDLLVNNAGSRYDNLAFRLTQAEWTDSFNDNVNGCFNVTQACLEGMMKRRFGRIVSIASIAGQMGSLGQSNYSASKAGVIALMKTIATEYASRNIRANAIAPGLIDTDMTKGMKAQLVEHFTERIPMKRFGSTAEVAGVVAFLLSEYSSYITGAVINVNGGALMA